MESIDARTIYIIIHVFGAVLGAGGAYLSDAMFFSSVKDRTITKTELRFMKIGSTFVWIGLTILLLSGLLIFSTNPEGYLASAKFLIKMTIVGVIFLNGIIFHVTHLPLMRKYADQNYDSSEEFVRKKKLLAVSGVISVTSWTLALLLAKLPVIPFSYPEAIGAYLLLEAVAIGATLLFLKRLF